MKQSAFELQDEAPYERVRIGLSTTGWMMLGALVAAGVLLRKLLQHSAAAQHSHTTEQRRDKILKDTFPASDAPASQYFDIPINRQ